MQGPFSRSLLRIASRSSIDSELSRAPRVVLSIEIVRCQSIELTSVCGYREQLLSTEQHIGCKDEAVATLFN
jgi:hypothetical protein